MCRDAKKVALRQVEEAIGSDRVQIVICFVRVFSAAGQLVRPRFRFGVHCFRYDFTAVNVFTRRKIQGKHILRLQ
jgi:hypothetical protein